MRPLVAVQADRKIVAVGWRNDRPPEFGYKGAAAFARYRPDGRLDRTFGTEGKVMPVNSTGAFLGGPRADSKIVKRHILGRA
jgi:hypothetical protein